MSKVQSKTRRSVIMAGVAGLATVAAPAIVTRSVVRPAHAQTSVAEAVTRIGRHRIPHHLKGSYETSGGDGILTPEFDIFNTGHDAFNSGHNFWTGQKTNWEWTERGGGIDIPIVIRNHHPNSHQNLRIKNVRVKLDISHPDFSGLEFQLFSPNGYHQRLWGFYYQGDYRIHQGLGEFGTYKQTDVFGNVTTEYARHWGRRPCARGAHLTLDDNFPTVLADEHCRLHEWIGGPGEAGHFSTGGLLASFRGRTPHHGTWGLRIINHDSERTGWLEAGELQVWSEADV